jgi:hypothetical protein
VYSLSSLSIVISLNTSILENKEYCKSIEKLITKYQHKFKEQTKLDILWDNFKLEVRDKTIDHCKKNCIYGVLVGHNQIQMRWFIYSNYIYVINVNW